MYQEERSPVILNKYGEQEKKMKTRTRLLLMAVLIGVMVFTTCASAIAWEVTQNSIPRELSVLTNMPNTLRSNVARIRTTNMDFRGNSISYFVVNEGAKSVNPQTTSINDCDEGWSWDASTRSLTLDGLNLVFNNPEGSNDGYAIALPASGGTIILSDGSYNSVTYSNRFWAPNEGISCGGSLTINGQVEGSGELYVEAPDSGAWASTGIFAGSYTQNGGIVSAVCLGNTPTNVMYPAAGIYSNGAVTVNGGILTSTCSPSTTASFGIAAGGNVTLNDGTVTATSSLVNYGGGSPQYGGSYGIRTSGNLTIKDADVTAKTIGYSIPLPSYVGAIGTNYVSVPYSISAVVLLSGNSILLSGDPMTMDAHYGPIETPSEPELYITSATVDFGMGTTTDTNDIKVLFLPNENCSDIIGDFTLWRKRIYTDSTSQVWENTGATVTAPTAPDTNWLAEYTISAPPTNVSAYQFEVRFKTSESTYVASPVQVVIKPRENAGSTVSVTPIPNSSTGVATIDSVEVKPGSTSTLIAVKNITIPAAVLNSVSGGLGSVVITSDSQPDLGSTQVDGTFTSPVIGIEMFDNAGVKITGTLSDHISLEVPYADKSIERLIVIFRHNGAPLVVGVNSADPKPDYFYTPSAGDFFTFYTKIFSDIEQYNAPVPPEPPVGTPASSTLTIHILVIIALGSVIVVGCNETCS